MRQKKKGRHRRKGAKGGATWNPFRSTGLVGFGMLTKKPTSNQNKQTPGTKRSAGGLVPGRSISRRGVAFETKRSLATGASGTHLTGAPFTKRSAPVIGGDTSPSATKLGRGVSMDRNGGKNIITRRSSHAKTQSRKPSTTNRATERSVLKKR